MWHINQQMLRSRILQLVLGGSALLLVGCAPTGSRAGQGAEYTKYVMSLYNDPAVGHGSRTIEFPAHVAVALIGETAPPPAFLDKLRNAKEFFAQVESLPAEEPDTPDPKGRDPVRRLESLARDQGADYLLIYGATVDSHTRVNSLSAIDLTIVGAYVPYTRDSEATARGSAVLIDVRTGTVVLTAGSEYEAKDKGSAASAEAVTDKLADDAQTKALASLGDQIVAAAMRRSAEQNAVDDAPVVRHATSVVAQEK